MLEFLGDLIELAAVGDECGNIDFSIPQAIHDQAEIRPGGITAAHHCHFPGMQERVGK